MPELEDDFAGRGYGDLKKEVAAVFADFAGPYRDRVLGYLADPAELDRLLARGAARAHEVAGPTLAAVHDAVGFLPPVPA